MTTSASDNHGGTFAFWGDSFVVGVYAPTEGLATIVLERSAVGGQAGSSSKTENYLGFPMGSAGRNWPSASASRRAASERRCSGCYGSLGSWR